VRLSLRIRDLLVASWRVERERARSLLPSGLEPAQVEDAHLVSLVAMRVEGGRLGALPVPPFSQLNLRTYVLYEGEPAVYFLFLRVTPPGLLGLALGAPYAPARISVQPGRVRAPGLGFSLSYRLGEVVDAGPIGLHEIGLFGGPRLRLVRISRTPAVWQSAAVEGEVRADPILHYGIGLDEPPHLVYAERAGFELSPRAWRAAP
jgi:Uncharacterized conserved protein (COG2071)